MKRHMVCGILCVAILFGLTCSGPKKSLEEEIVLTALTNIQRSLENNASYEQFVELLGQAKAEIDNLKSNGNNNPCFIGAVDKCYAFYFTGRKAWKQKLEATDEARKTDMDITLSVLQSRAALSIQMANNCYKN